MNPYWIAAAWMGMALVASLSQHPRRHLRGSGRDRRRRPCRQHPGQRTISCSRPSSPPSWPHWGRRVLNVPGRGGDRPRQPATALAGQHRDRVGQFRHPVRGGAAVQPLRARLVLVGSGDLRGRAVHHLGGGGLRRDGGDRPEPCGPRENSSSPPASSPTWEPSSRSVASSPTSTGSFWSSSPSPLAAMWFMPALTRLVLRTVGGRVSEPEIKFLLGVLARPRRAGERRPGARRSCPAYLTGLVVAGVFMHDRDRRSTGMRAIAFALLTPFFFLRAGLLDLLLPPSRAASPLSSLCCSQ